MGLWRLSLMTTIHESICSDNNVAQFSTALARGKFYFCVNWKLNLTSEAVVRDYLKLCGPSNKRV